MSSRIPRLFIAGDSVPVHRSVGFAPAVGWGQVLQIFLDRDRVSVVNCARGASSSRSFYDRGRFEWILDELRAGDYVLLSHGRNDTKAEEGVGTAAFGAYVDYMRTYISCTRLKGAHPIFVESTESGDFDSHGNHLSWLGEHPAALRELAEEAFVPVVDLRRQSLNWWDGMDAAALRRTFMILGPQEASPPLAQGRGDTLHFRAPGAVNCARFIVSSLIRQGIIPQDWATGLDRTEFDVSEIGWLSHQEVERRQNHRRRSVSPRPLGYAPSAALDVPVGALVVSAVCTDPDRPEVRTAAKLWSSVAMDQMTPSGGDLVLELHLSAAREVSRAEAVFHSRSVSSALTVVSAECRGDVLRPDPSGGYRITCAGNESVAATLRARVTDFPGVRVAFPQVSTGFTSSRRPGGLRSTARTGEWLRLGTRPAPGKRIVTWPGAKGTVSLREGLPAGSRVVSFSPPFHGTARVTAEGDLLYRPEPGFTGYDLVMYRVEDASGTVFSAPVTVIVADSETAAGASGRPAPRDEPPVVQPWRDIQLRGEIPGMPAEPVLRPPVITSPTSGALAQGRMLRGTADTSSTLVEVSVDGAIHSNVTIDSEGNWEWSPGEWYTPGRYELSVRSLSLEGPSDPTIVGLSVDPSLIVPAEGDATGQRPRIFGMAYPGARRVRILVDGNELAQVPADPHGRWWHTPAEPIALGCHTITCEFTAPSGELSTRSAAVTVCEEPMSPVIRKPIEAAAYSELPRIEGVAPGGATRVTLHMDGRHYSTVAVRQDGRWWLNRRPADTASGDSASCPPGTHRLQATSHWEGQASRPTEVFFAIKPCSAHL